jgi:hypothetical protein
LVSIIGDKTAIIQYVKKIRDYLPVLLQKQIKGDPNKCIVPQYME